MFNNMMNWRLQKLFSKLDTINYAKLERDEYS